MRRLGSVRRMHAATPTWTTLFLDFDAASYERGVAFWRNVTGYGRSPMRGDRRRARHPRAARRRRAPPGPAARHPGPSRVHLTCTSTTWWRRCRSPRNWARGCGALRRGATSSSWTSPGGFTFCLVPSGESVRTAPADVAGRAAQHRRPALPRHPAAALRRRGGVLAGPHRLGVHRADRRERVRLAAPPGRPARTDAAAAAGRRCRTPCARTSISPRPTATPRSRGTSASAPGHDRPARAVDGPGGPDRMDLLRDRPRPGNRAAAGAVAAYPQCCWAGCSRAAGSARRGSGRC